MAKIDGVLVRIIHLRTTSSRMDLLIPGQIPLYRLSGIEVRMRELPPSLRRKVDDVLLAYGGLRGLANRPAWLMDIVLKTFFTDAEAKEILKYLAHRRSKNEGIPAM